MYYLTLRCAAPPSIMNGIISGISSIHVDNTQRFSEIAIILLAELNDWNGLKTRTQNCRKSRKK